ncbi:Proline--tRNA ligase [Porphyridium purpureum]|uniref:proline--tRNA ligase n=1 Tax=Porphyridium purpureum TaxID=35688 RepID=A0A5J4YUG4_PORPP|nr:Proline--tRNA ligase [Porphyridium purpureum]|eukprot:POR3400..scf227_4
MSAFVFGSGGCHYALRHAAEQRCACVCGGWTGASRAAGTARTTSRALSHTLFVRCASAASSSTPASSSSDATQTQTKKQQGGKPNTGGPAASAQQQGISSRANDYSQWYLDVLAAGELVDTSPVKGCMVIRPHGFAIWEFMRDWLDARLKARGVQNAYFPIFIPQSFLSKEAEHVEGFAKECAVVTHHRLRVAADPGANNGQVLEVDPDAKLEEPLVVRPTSETIIWNMFQRWISSYRELPLLINQWANVVRWEMRTRPFLRTTEFLWQEGHTAHASAEEALSYARDMIDVYAELCENMLAMPVVKGIKSPSERFAGAEETFTIEGQMQNGWALQCGTSHFLGQNFARAFDVYFMNQEEKRELVWATSWGVSTRLMGALIMTHSDDTGLVLPPSVAPVQVILIPIFKNAETKAQVGAYVSSLRERLLRHGVRVKVDDRENVRPGAKYFEWERKGVCLRMEVGPRDMEKNQTYCASRTRKDKFSIPVDEQFERSVLEKLSSIQRDMLETAKARVAARTFRVDSYDEMKQMLSAGADNAGFYIVPWKCDADNERQIKEECKATIRCYPMDMQHEVQGKVCFYSNEPATHMAIFARAY